MCAEKRKRRYKKRNTFNFMIYDDIYTLLCSTSGYSDIYSILFIIFVEQTRKKRLSQDELECDALVVRSQNMFEMVVHSRVWRVTLCRDAACDTDSDDQSDESQIHAESFSRENCRV